MHNLVNLDRGIYELLVEFDHCTRLEWVDLELTPSLSYNSTGDLGPTSISLTIPKGQLWQWNEGRENHLQSALGSLHKTQDKYVIHD